LPRTGSATRYLVLASLLVGVRCDSTKQGDRRDRHRVPEGRRERVDGPVGAERRTCTGANACFVAIDLFSYDNHPVAFPGDQLYCASGFGVVGVRTLEPGSGCEHDVRI
jgi:hypothetical protein